jgi:PIN domain nuclease of toxin-antitoxin system
MLEPVTLDDILALSMLPTLHRDPFDRLIIA